MGGGGRPSIRRQDHTRVMRALLQRAEMMRRLINGTHSPLSWRRRNEWIRFRCAVRCSYWIIGRLRRTICLIIYRWQTRTTQISFKLYDSDWHSPFCNITFQILVGLLPPTNAMNSAAYAVARCPSVCPSRSGIVSKRLNISSNYLL